MSRPAQDATIPSRIQSIYSRRIAVVSASLWLATLAIALYLTFQRYSAALADNLDTDIRVFFQAAQHVRAHQDVYQVSGYVYLPIVSWLFTPFSTLAQAKAAVTIASLVSCWGAIGCMVATTWRSLSSWQRPLLAAVGVITLLYNYPLDNELWLGQIDNLLLFLVSASVMFAAMQWNRSSGAVLAIAAVLKTWPAGTWIWLFRRGAQHRLLTAVSALCTSFVLVVIPVAVDGPGVIGEWIARTLAFSSQPLLSYSVWGIGRFLFTSNTVTTPWIDAPIAGAAISLLLAAGVLFLVAVTLRRPGSDALAMWHCTGALVLLLPVSHIVYQVLFIPLVWCWTAQVMTRPTRLSCVPLAVLTGYWLIAFRLPSLTETHTTGNLQFLAVVASALVALATSVLVTAHLERRGCFATEPVVGQVAMKRD